MGVSVHPDFDILFIIQLLPIFCIYFFGTKYYQFINGGISLSNLNNL